MKRYFEFVGKDASRASGQTSKFWEVTVINTELSVRFGKIGGKGQTNTKTFPDAKAAKVEAEKLIAEKLRKGYVESGATLSGNPTDKGQRKVPASKSQSPRDKVAAWIHEYGIYLAVDAEDSQQPDPKELGWDLDCVWTWWDSNDEILSYATPGFDGHRRFVNSWLLGKKAHTGQSTEVVLIARTDCANCDTEGCAECDEMGWTEEDYFSEAGAEIVWGSNNTRPETPMRADKREANQHGMKDCVACAEQILSKAKLCKHCGTLQDDPKFADESIDNQTDAAFEVDSDDYELTDADELCTDAMAQLNQLTENDNVECVKFFDKQKSLICEVRFEYEVMDVAFSNEIAGALKIFEPQDDDDGNHSKKHVYLEPDDFFQFEDGETGYGLMDQIFRIAGCRSQDEVQSQNILRNKRGPKGYYVIQEI